MKILIAGVKGQLGTALLKILNHTHICSELVLTDRSIMDITNLEHIKEYLFNNKPDVVVNCAAYTAVDQAEQDEEMAYRVNALGAQNLAIICDTFDIKLVHISTDYIFDGKHEMPYIEGDQVNPQNVYGKSKLAGEEAVRRLCKKHFILRTAWLYGEGNNFVRTMLKLAQTNSEINVVGDQFGTPTYTKDLAKVIIELMHTEYYGTYHATCEGSCSWYEFACEIFRLKNINIKVNQVTSEAFTRPAKRPKYAVLENENLKKLGLNTFRPWQEALADYLEIDAAWQEEHLGGKANG